MFWEDIWWCGGNSHDTIFTWKKKSSLQTHIDDMVPHLKVTNCHVEESRWKVKHQNVKMIISGYWKHRGFSFLRRCSDFSTLSCTAHVMTWKSTYKMRGNDRLEKSSKQSEYIDSNQVCKNTHASPKKKKIGRKCVQIYLVIFSGWWRDGWLPFSSLD